MSSPQAHGTHGEMPKELSSRRIWLRLLQLGAIVVVVVGVILLFPGSDGLRDRFGKAAPGWLVLAWALEVGSVLSYVVIFRAVFCRHMPWRLGYHIGMAEQAANSLVPTGGAGGLALGAWALRRTGMSAASIARRTVAFFLLTSLANFLTVIVFAAAFAVGLLGRDRAPAVTYGFGAAALVAVLGTLSVPALTSRFAAHFPAGGGSLRTLLGRAATAIGGGVSDSIALLRARDLGTIFGSLGYMGFDIAVLGVCFLAFGYTPGLGVLVLGYLIGQLGALLPTPGGIGGTEGGLIGMFALYHVPINASAAAIIAYRAIALWTPALIGSISFVRLRSALPRPAPAAAT